MSRYLALTAAALVFAVSPAMAQTACEQESRVILDRSQPNESADKLASNTRDQIIVSRFLVIPTENCNLGPQQPNMQLVQGQQQPEDTGLN